MDAFMLSTPSKLVVTLLLVLACAAPVRAARPAAPGVALHFCVDACGQLSNTFVLNGTRDLNVFVSWHKLQGSHVQRLVFRLPSGDVYQSIESRFDVRKLPRAAGMATTHNVLPIAGTWIQQRAVVGKWTVDLYLDGKLVHSQKLNLR